MYSRAGRALVQYVLAEGAAGFASVLTIYAHPIKNPLDVAETHQNARRRKRGCKAEGRGEIRRDRGKS